MNNIADVYGHCRAIAWSLEDSANRMMRSSFHAMDDGDRAGAAREQIIAIREYEWAAKLYEALGIMDDEHRARKLAADVQAGEWRESARKP